VVAAAGVIALIAFFNSRDESTTDAPAQTAPAKTDQGSATDELAAGNVVLVYGPKSMEAKLRRLAAQQSGEAEPDAALISSGQAVIVRREPGEPGVKALAFRHSISAASPDDPALADFIAQYLGGS
jgi:hypothetical protein